MDYLCVGYPPEGPIDPRYRERIIGAESIPEAAEFYARAHSTDGFDDFPRTVWVNDGKEWRECNGQLCMEPTLIFSVKRNGRCPTTPDMFEAPALSLRPGKVA